MRSTITPLVSLWPCAGIAVPLAADAAPQLTVNDGKFHTDKGEIPAGCLV